MRERDRRTAERFGLIELCDKLEQALLKIEGVTTIEYDLDGYYDGFNQVIALVGYDYHYPRAAIVSRVLDVAGEHELKRSGDTIEDYGAHYYFVFDACGLWRRERPTSL